MRKTPAGCAIIMKFGGYQKPASIHNRCITLTGHFYGASAMILNEAHYQSWPPEVRSAVDAAAPEATAFQRRLAAGEDAEMLAKFDSGEVEIIRLTDTERSAFVDRLKPVLDRHRKEFDPQLFARLAGD